MSATPRPPLTPSTGANAGADARSADASFNPQRRSASPRRVRNGIRLRSRTVPPALSELALQWLQRATNGLDPEVMRQGLEYARSGQVISLDLQAGKAAARVQGRLATAYATTLAWPVFDDAQWERIIMGLSAGAVNSARLLNDELPPGLEGLLTMQGLTLLPDATNIQTACTCEHEKPCKHAVALAYLVADRLDESPTSALQLRGRSAGVVIDRIREVRVRGLAEAGVDHQVGAPDGAAASTVPGADVTGPANGLPNGNGGSPTNGADARGAAALLLAGIGADPPALETCVDDFWRCPAPLEAAAPRDLEHPPHALLHRLGPSPMGGRFPLVGLLASIYDTVSAHAKVMQDEAGAEARPRHANGNSES